MLVKDIYWILRASDILLLIATLCKNGCKFNLDKNGVLSLGDLLTEGILNGKVYLMPCKIEEDVTIASSSTLNYIQIE